MKTVVLAALLLSSVVAHAEDEMSPSGDSAAPEEIPAETLEQPPVEAAPAPAPQPAARINTTKVRARTEKVKDDGEGRLEKKEDTVAGGTHWRIKTNAGAVHVWVPANYDRATAGTVVYIHGYWTDADGAWREHSLARQFRASRQNALFIVPDAPSANEDSVKWPALKDLRKAIARANIKIPDGPTIVIGHSGAFRTIMQWVDHRAVEQIILLDAMYAGESAFDEFIKSGKRANQHKLIVVAAGTAQSSESFAKKYKFAVAREKMPSSYDGFTRRERGAKLLYVRSQFDHMAIVTSGKVIPLLLRLTALKAL